MSSVESQPPAGQAPPPPPDPSKPPAGRHKGWMWLSIGLVVACVGLLIWGVSKNSDLSDAQAAQETNTAVATEAYKNVNETLGATTEQLDQANSDVTESQATADQAQKDATAAQKDASAAQADAASAKGDQAAAEATTKQAQADTKAAESKLDVAKSCAKAYATAVGSLFDGDDIKAQAAKVKDQLSAITKDCQAALGG